MCVRGGCVIFFESCVDDVFDLVDEDVVFVCLCMICHVLISNHDHVLI